MNLSLQELSGKLQDTRQEKGHFEMECLDVGSKVTLAALAAAFEVVLNILEALFWNDRMGNELQKQ